MLEELDRQLGKSEAEALRETLMELAGQAEAALSGNFVGAYLKGSFALGTGDIWADVDFLVVTSEAISSQEEAAVRAIHRSMPERLDNWSQHLEGSYASLAQLRERAEPETPWLYVDNGAREMEWSTHDNNEVFRWVLRNRALVIAGPAPVTLISPVPTDVMRREAVALGVSRARDVESEPAYLLNGWGQPHEVLTRCRILYTATTGEVAGKAVAAEWCKSTVSSEWHDLIDQAVNTRAEPSVRAQRTVAPQLAERTWHFVGYMLARAEEAVQDLT